VTRPSDPSRLTEAASDPGLEALTSPLLAPFFLPPPLLQAESDWHPHLPFAAWLVPALRPRLIVEAGTRGGLSYAALCEAVAREALDARCLLLAAGPALPAFDRLHAARYAAFSECRPGETPAQAVPEGGIDLLHLDLPADHAAAGHAFDAWRSLLSDRAVVLLHGINRAGADGGARRFWAGLRQPGRCFDFLHGAGLGVLATGPEIPAAIAALCRATDPEAVHALRERLALIGERWVLAGAVQEEAVAEAVREARTLRRQLSETRFRLARAEQALTKAQAKAQGAAEAREAAETEAVSDGTAPDDAADATDPVVAPAPRGRAIRLVSRLIHYPRARGAVRRALRLRDRLLGRTPIDLYAPRRRVLFVSGEPGTPGSIYRVDRYAAAAAALGWESAAVDLADVNPQILAGAAIVVIWRAPWSPHLQGIYEHCALFGARIVYDVDDLVFRPELADAAVIDGIRSQGLSEASVHRFFAMVRHGLREATLVTCSTLELAHHARALQIPAMVLPNGFDAASLAMSRLLVRQREEAGGDGLVRIGYASGSRTHQKDFAVAVGAIARVLAERPQCRLVLFRDPRSGQGVVLPEEFPQLRPVADQIEWRDMVKLPELPRELARFDINLAPLEPENPFVAAKSELKFFEAALVDVVTVASPVGPFRRAIEPGVTGFLPETEEAWYATVLRLVDEPALRRQVARAAYHDALWMFGPERRAELVGSMLDQVVGGAAAARAFELDLRRGGFGPLGRPRVPETEVLFRADTLRESTVTVVIPLYNYAGTIVEALESVRAQTLDALDLVVVDDASTDDSAAIAVEWVTLNADRFNRVLVLRNRGNSGLGFTRNAAFAAAETPFVLPLDADNRLLPGCCARLLSTLQGSTAAFAYPRIQTFGAGDAGKQDYVMGKPDFLAQRLVGGNYIDAMALVGKWAWAAAGGYEHVRFGWEDYDFWCRLLELGFWGEAVPGILAEYRIHGGSMLHTSTQVWENKRSLIADMHRRHPWLAIAEQSDYA